MTLHYRPFTMQDQDSVQRLMSDYPLQFPSFVIDRYPPRWSDYVSAKTSESEYWVAEDAELGVVGHTGFIYNDELGIYEIVGVVTSTDRVRRGIGKGLLQIVCSRIQERGQDQTILFTLGHLGNRGTIQFYSSLGFTQTNEEQDYFAKGFHRVTFEKTLR
ncbi:GNAT family N-acetyltransferase [Paenibacillus selenitireducens]|uniref:GNAT family N-acetyltransferase n=1 Tax=Paenibacillus selenitireducens TaxID=1324314 RepID=A0A1T2XN44_9BACL|nr:GNAT family N-acetyltransferase [Paenibacillus selenitireducens]OPA81238.1 GNAT family N-acetyltransferase [Paenibacillus selenitireducens]